MTPRDRRIYIYMYMVEKLFHEEGIQIIGLQETRIQGNFDSTSVHFRIISSGATKCGSQGVQIWISLHLNCKILATLPISSRCLFVVVDICARIIIICSLHVPDRSSSEPCLGVWNSWSVGLAKLQRKFPHAHLLGCVDANGRSESEQCEYVGQVQPDHEDERGDALRRSCRDFEITPCNTHFETGHTWTHSSGKTSRIVYFLSKDWIKMTWFNYFCIVFCDMFFYSLVHTVKLI